MVPLFCAGALGYLANVLHSRQPYCGPASRRRHVGALDGCQVCRPFCMPHSTRQFVQLHHTDQLHQFPFRLSNSIATISITKHILHTSTTTSISIVNYINFHHQLHQFPFNYINFHHQPHRLPLHLISTLFQFPHCKNGPMP